MSEGTMNREDEIRAMSDERLREIQVYPDILLDLGMGWPARAILDLLTENARLRARCEALEEHVGKTADGVCLHECESHYCPHCNNKIERGDSFSAYCDHCPNPDGGAYPAEPPLPMFWEQTLAKPKEDAK